MGVAERRARERQQRSDTIIAAAERLVFRYGIERVTMQQIADEVELNKATIYLYFTNKDDLLHAIISRGLEILIAMLEEVLNRGASGLATLEAVAWTYFDFYRAHPDYHRALLHRERPPGGEPEPREPSHYDIVTDDQARKLLELIGEGIRRGISDGSVRGDADPSRDAALLVAQLTGVVQTVDRKGEVLALVGAVAEEIFASSAEMVRRYFLTFNNER